MSYYTTLNLEKEPFTTSPDPTFFYHSINHMTALRRLEISIRLKRGLNVILGDVGIGKTTLSRMLFQLFNQEDDYVFHMILDPVFASEQLFWEHLARLFGLNPFFRTAIDYRQAVEKYLYQKNIEEKKTVVLVIDEGQKLSVESLEILRVLLNYETNEHKMLQLVILSQMELLGRIMPIKNLVDRISLKYIISPLDEIETGELIYFRLKQAGYRSEKNLFTFDAIKRIYEYSEGYPRRIAVICHMAIEQLVMREREHVTGELIEQIIERDKAWV